VEPTLAFLETLARQAGDILRAGQLNGFQVSHKGVIDLVTEVDQRCEQFLLGEIQHTFPGHHIISEETGGVQGSCDHVWYVDPIDGTVNYAHGLPFFCVSIAYETQGEIKLGVVYDPMRDELFAAQRGRGAWLNTKALKVSGSPTLDQSLLVTGFPYDIRTNPVNNLDNYVRFSRHSQGVRRLGSAALDLCYVACARADGFWEVRLKSYDIAAGALIAQEAGALVTTITGDPDFLAGPVSILAATPAIHPEMLALLNGG
jgi:myo-inositol-1(or 4)-monophosphatase